MLDLIADAVRLVPAQASQHTHASSSRALQTRPMGFIAAAERNASTISSNLAVRFTVAFVGIEDEFDAVLERHLIGTPSAVAAGAVAFGPVEFDFARLNRRCWRRCRRRCLCEGTTSFVVDGGGDGGDGGTAGHAEYLAVRSSTPLRLAARLALRSQEHSRLRAEVKRGWTTFPCS